MYICSNAILSIVPPFISSTVSPSLSSMSVSALKMKVKSVSRVRLSATPWTGPLHSSVHGILQARILEWVAFPFSRGSSQPRDQTQVSSIEVRFFSVQALQVYLHCCPANWCISTIFLDPIYMHKYVIFVFLFLISLCIICSRFNQLIRTNSIVLLYTTE